VVLPLQTGESSGKKAAKDFRSGILTLCIYEFHIELWPSNGTLIRKNKEKHHIGFEDARRAWLDPSLATAKDIPHSTAEETQVLPVWDGGGDVLTVRFTRKANVISIIEQSAAICR